MSTPAEARDPGRLLIYPTVTRPDAVRLIGRLIEDEGHEVSTRKRSRLRNLVQSVRALESDEIVGATVEITAGPHRWTAVTDADGMWRVEVDGLNPPLPLGVMELRGRVLSGDEKHPTPPNTGQLFVVKPDAHLMVSDFDDTVVHSYITDRSKMIRLALLTDPHRMLAVRGAPNAYQKARTSGVDAVIYLSGSPQNFITRIQAFLRINAFPAGAILLKNFGIKPGSDPLFDQVGYKRGHLEALMRRFPKATFTLVGDAGEHDAEIYRAVAQAHPGRVRAIFIRRVEGRSPEPASGLTVIDDFSGVNLTP